MAPSRETALTGIAAAPGVAMGVVRRWDAPSAEDGPLLAPEERRGAADSALRALEAAAAQLDELGSDLRARGRIPEAEIIETGGLMACDPALRDAVTEQVVRFGRPAPAALMAAADAWAATLAGLPDPMLAARAADVRSVGMRAARIALGGLDPGGTRGAGGDDSDGVVVVSGDLGPADVAELGPDVRALALAGGGITGHAAIVARSLGLPMVIGLGAAAYSVPDGSAVIVDGGTGTVLLSPTDERITAVREVAERRREGAARAAAERALPAVTTDGRRVTVMVNASSAAEVALGLEAGAEGVGLVRTELAFLDATAWPTADQHRRVLGPVLAPLRGRVATVRLLDFGADKTPPFLVGESGRGVQLLLRAPHALRDQLAAILECGSGSELRVLVPMVTEPSEVDAVRAALREVAGGPGATPPVGAMVEVPAAATMADTLARECDFLSIGTNDLTQFQLGIDRTQAASAPAHHPAVLRLIDTTVRAAGSVGIPVEVCGEAASDPVAMPLLVGLGVDELSVGAARVGEVRSWVRRIEYGTVRRVAREALDAGGASAVAAAVLRLRDGA